MKTVCIYHAIDLDGWMSAAIVMRRFKLDHIGGFVVKEYRNNNRLVEESILNRKVLNSIDFIGYNYGHPVPDLSEYDKVIICDVSFISTVMSALNFDKNKKIVWIDHHISAINESIKPTDDGIIYDRDGSKVTVPYDKVEGIRNDKFSACELTWKYFFPCEEMPEIVRLLGRYDCFGHKGTDEEQKVLEFQYGARMVISNYEQAYDFLKSNIQYGNTVCESIYIDGVAIYRYLCTEAKQAYKNGFNLYLKDYSSTDTEFRYRKFICINKERFNPINFGIDYHVDGYDGASCFHYDGVAKLWRFSLYNDNGLVDCSLIAKTFGGGGHKGASGFILDNEKFIELISNKEFMNINLQSL